MSLRLDWCSHEAAKYACENWHYSGCVPAGKVVKIGVWESSIYIGCVLFSRGAPPKLAGSFGLKQTECCELTRIALTTHTHPVTRIVRIAIKKLREFCPGLRLVVSFADPTQGHIGGIYQGGNWVFAGYSAQCGGYEYFIDGKWMHPRSIGARFGTRSIDVIERKLGSVPKRKPSRKLRYLMPLDQGMENLARTLSKPYPKRAGSKANVVSANHAEEGGVTPTPALQFENRLDGE